MVSTEFTYREFLIEKSASIALTMADTIKIVMGMSEDVAEQVLERRLATVRLMLDSEPNSELVAPRISSPDE